MKPLQNLNKVSTHNEGNFFFFLRVNEKLEGESKLFFYEVADEIITKQGADEALMLVCTQMYKT